MSKKELDIDEEIRKLSRNSNINMRKSEYSFESRLKQLDKDIERASNSKIKEFDENKQITLDYLSTDYRQDTIDRYREKLKRI